MDGNGSYIRVSMNGVSGGRMESSVNEHNKQRK